MKELNNARESKQDCLGEWFQTAGRGGRYDRLQRQIQQAAEADTASRSFNISSNVKFQIFNFKSECQMKRILRKGRPRSKDMETHGMLWMRAGMDAWP